MTASLDPPLVPIALISAKNIAALGALMATQFIPKNQKLSTDEVEEILKKSEVNRAIYHGGVNEWFPAKRLPNPSGYDRDSRAFEVGFDQETRTHINGYIPTESTDKAASNLRALASEETTIDSDKDGFNFENAIVALRGLAGKDWMKVGDARSNSKPLRKATRDIDDVRLIIAFLQKDGEAEIKEGDLFKIINPDGTRC